MRLAELQRTMLATILDPAQPAQTELHVHHTHFWTRMSEFVSNWQPLLARLLGPDELTQLVRRYVVAHPPSSVLATDVANRLADFLAVTHPWSAMPIVAALAAYDRRRALLFAVAEEVTVTAAKLAAIDPAVLAPVRFRLKQQTALVAAPYRFDARHIEQLDRATPLDAEPSYRLLYVARRRHALLELDHRTYRAYEPLVDGITLGALADHLRGLGFTDDERAAFRDHLLATELLVAIRG